MSEYLVKETYHKQVQKVLVITLLLNLAVVLGKAIAGYKAGSLTLLSDAFHSLADAINNIVGIIIMKYASAPPDKEHPYGHSKFETLGAFSIAGFLSITCFEIGSRALYQVFSGDQTLPNINYFTVSVVLITLFINYCVAVYEGREGKKLQSEILIADSAHTTSDIYVSFSVLLSIFFSWWGYRYVDSVFSLLIAGFIAYKSFEIFSQTVPILVDAATIDSQKIKEIALEIEGVSHCRNIRSRGRAGDLFIEMVVLVDATDLEKAHIITQKIEEKLFKEFGRVMVTIHFEPA